MVMLSITELPVKGFSDFGLTYTYFSIRLIEHVIFWNLTIFCTFLFDLVANWTSLLSITMGTTVPHPTYKRIYYLGPPTVLLTLWVECAPSAQSILGQLIWFCLTSNSGIKHSRKFAWHQGPELDVKDNIVFDFKLRFIKQILLT